jgi:hypothetical protein
MALGFISERVEVRPEDVMDEEGLEAEIHEAIQCGTCDQIVIACRGRIMAVILMDKEDDEKARVFRIPLQEGEFEELAFHE